LFEKIRAAFEKKFVHDDGFVAGADQGPFTVWRKNEDLRQPPSDTQTGYVFGVAFMNLVPENFARWP